MTRYGTVEPVSRDQILRREQGQENIHFSCSADHEQDWQNLTRMIFTLAIFDEMTIRTNTHTYIHTYEK